jgi:hypothetical protein
VREQGRLVVKAPFAQAQAWIDVFDQLPDDATREHHLVALVDIARAVEHWARVSPKWYPTGTGRRRPSVEPHELAQAIFIESEAAPAWVGKCPDCAGSGLRQQEPAEELVHEIEQLVSHGMLTSSEAAAVLRKCPSCNGTAEQYTPVAVLLSDAADGNVPARDALLAHADKLLAEGNPLGELLNRTLLLWMQEPADLTHADEAVRWLEWLTAQHESSCATAARAITSSPWIAAHVGMTSSQIAAALNAQGGPATFSANADGMTYTLMYGTNSHIGVDLLPPPPQVPEESPRRGHAQHIGSRLGRRLGVRR